MSVELNFMWCKKTVTPALPVERCETIEKILTEEQLCISRELSGSSPQQLRESKSSPILTPSPVKLTIHASLAWREETVVFWERAPPPSCRLFASLQLFDFQKEPTSSWITGKETPAAAAAT